MAENKIKGIIFLIMLILSCLLISKLSDIRYDDIIGYLLFYGVASVLYFGYKCLVCLCNIIFQHDDNTYYYNSQKTKNYGGTFDLSKKKSFSPSQHYDTYVTDYIHPSSSRQTSSISHQTKRSEKLLIKNIMKNMPLNKNVVVQPIITQENDSKEQ